MNKKADTKLSERTAKLRRSSSKTRMGLNNSAIADWIKEKPPQTKPLREKRRTTYKFATIRFGANQSVNAILNDISDGGAKITLEYTAPLTNVVTLSSSTIGVAREARVVWQNGSQAGLKFLEHGRLRKRIRSIFESKSKKE